MPETVNGIGTWYYGRTNTQLSQDQCEYCGKFGELKSYDTTLYFVFFFIPLIPLGRKRILDECPHCKRHRYMALGKWERMKREKLFELGRKYKEQPGNKDTAVELIQAIFVFKVGALLNTIAPLIEKHFAGDEEVLGMLGAAFGMLGQTAEAERCHRKAHNLKDTPETRISLANALIEQMRPGEAEPLIGYILDEKKDDDMPMLAILIQGYQAVGQHQEALNLMERAAAAFPDLEQDPSFIQMRKVSIRHRQTHTPITSAKPSTREPANSSPISLWTARLTGPAIALLLICGHLLWAHSLGNRRTWYLVSGQDNSYKVSINDKTYHLQPYSVRTIMLPEGRISVAFRDPDIDIDPEGFTFSTPFFMRPFSSRTLVLNPDRTAVLFWQKIRYSSHENPHHKTPHRTYAGKLWYNLDHINFKFKKLPDSISSESSAVMRSAIQVIDDSESALQILLNQAEQQGMQPVIDHLRYKLALHPDDDQALMIYSTLSEPDEALATIKKRLTDSPARIEWHRIYQDLLPRVQPQTDLTAEYRKLLAKNPDDAELIYLLGRLLPNDQAEQMFIRAANASPPSAHALHALAFDCLNVIQEYDKGLDYVRKAIALKPEKDQFQSTEYDLMLANKQYDVLLKRCNRELKQASNETDKFFKISEKICLLTKLGRVSEARASLDQFIKKLSSHAEVTKDDVREARYFLEALLLHAHGDVRGFVEKTATDKELGWQSKLLSGDLAGAFKMLEAMPKPTAYDFLLIYAGQTLSNNPDNAPDQALAKAIEMLKKNVDSHKQSLVDILESGKTDFDALKNLKLYGTQKAIALAAVGIKIPALRNQAFDLGANLNFGMGPPQLVLAQIMKK